MMKKHFIHAWNPWITGGVQDLAYEKEEDSIITGSSPMYSHLGHTTGRIWADHALGLSDSGCFSLLSSAHTDKIESKWYVRLMKILALFILDKVAYWIY